MMTRHNIDHDNLVSVRKEIISIARRCFSLKLQTNSGGNLSARLSCRDAIVIKPSGLGYFECSHDNLMVCDLEGQVIEGRGKPSKDLGFHCGIYQERADVNAIVHVHSPWAIGYSHLNLPFECATVQSVGKLGRLVPCIDLASGGKPQGEAEVRPVFANNQLKAALLRAHGTIGVGKDLISAQYIVELLEESCHAAFAASWFHNLPKLMNETQGHTEIRDCFPRLGQVD